jgi:hypothetical protein
VNGYAESARARRTGPDRGAPTPKAIWFGLCLVLLASVSACGSSKPSEGAQASPGRTGSTQADSASFDPAQYELDSGGFGSNGSAVSDAGYTERYVSPAGLDHLAEAYDIISRAMPKAVDLNEVKAEEPGNVQCEVSILWQPMGRRDTALPPGGHGERIYEIDVDLGPYLKAGDAVAYVWFVSRAQGDALDPNILTATPEPYPNQAYSFRIDRETAAALLAVFWTKGPKPTD